MLVCLYSFLSHFAPFLRFPRKERRSDDAGLPVNISFNSVSPENPSIKRYLDSEERFGMRAEEIKQRPALAAQPACLKLRFIRKP